MWGGGGREIWKGKRVWPRGFLVVLSWYRWGLTMILTFVVIIVAALTIEGGGEGGRKEGK
jgi:hypothetical protein